MTDSTLIIKQMDRMERKIDTLYVRMEAICVKLEVCVKHNESMREHVDFINRTYSKLKSPLNFVASKFARAALQHASSAVASSAAAASSTSTETAAALEVLPD